MPVLFGSVSAAMGMVPVFWIDALMLAYGGILMRDDAKQKAADPLKPD